MPDISLTILGTAAGLARPDRVNSGYVLDVDGRLIQIDCGGGISSAFRRAGFDPMAVEKIVISHGHADHVCDLPLYVQMMYLLGREERLIVHLPSELIEPITNLFRALYLFPEKLTWLDFQPVPENGSIDADGVVITPIPNRHQQATKSAEIIAEHGFPNKMQCYSYLIEVGGRKILYSADLGSEEDIFSHMSGADILVVESMHIDIGNLFESASTANIGRIVLTHFQENFDAHEAFTQAEKYGLKNLIFATDGLRLEM